MLGVHEGLRSQALVVDANPGVPSLHRQLGQLGYHAAAKSEAGICTGALLGVHEGPRSQALVVDANPGVSSLHRQLGQPGNSVITYSKGAAFFQMLESLWEAALPGSFQVGADVI